MNLGVLRRKTMARSRGWSQPRLLGARAAREPCWQGRRGCQGGAREASSQPWAPPFGPACLGAPLYSLCGGPMPPRRPPQAPVSALSFPALPALCFPGWDAQALSQSRAVRESSDSLYFLRGPPEPPYRQVWGGPEQNRPSLGPSGCGALGGYPVGGVFPQ